VVGLACARALAQAGEEVWLLEAASALGQGISSRSSEVIHAGLYYPEDSLKAALCCRGRELLYEFCAARGVGHRKLGKLIVAAGRGRGRGELEALKARGDALGVPGLTC
jgi:L-2-hydroxyglutarate oxidase LhgO